MENEQTRTLIARCLKDFLAATGKECGEIEDHTDLLQHTGATSDEGVEFACDLSDVLGFDVPADFNPFVDDSGRRGRKFSDLVESVQKFSGRR